MHLNLILNGAPTLAEYAELWLMRVAPTLRPNSRRLYRYALEEHVGTMYGDRRVDSITRCDVRALAELLRARYAPKTVRYIIAAFSALLSGAVEDGILAANPAFRLRLPRNTVRRAPAFRGEQLGLFLAATARAHPRLSLIFELCGHVGLRIGEARAVRIGDADLDARMLHIVRTAHQLGRTDPPKDGPRIVRLPPRLTARLRAHETTVTDWYFPGRYGPICYSHIRRIMANACTEVGLQDRGTTALRRTFISAMLASGAAPEWCRQQAGHASLETTMVYDEGFATPDPDAFAAL